MARVRRLRHDRMRTRCLRLALALTVVLVLLLRPGEGVAGPGDPWNFKHPQRVTIRGYSGDAMEPFVTRDGKYLLFNNLNDSSVNTNLHYARRIDDLTYQYEGEIEGVNTLSLEATPTMDRNGVLYFVSTRSYAETYSTIYRGHFSSGRVTDVELVPGVSRNQAGFVNFDVEVSADGDTLYFVDSQFANGVPRSAEIVIALRRGPGFERMPDSSRIMEQVNSDALQYAPCISRDGLTLFFTRADRELREAAIYLATRRSTTLPFGPPARLAAIDGFVEAPTLSPDERSLYYHKKERDGFVIYSVTR